MARRGRDREVLQPFRSLRLSWAGRGELPTVTAVEAVELPLALVGEPLLCGFYLNELLVRLVPRQDPCPAIFQLYQQTLINLAKGAHQEEALRCFEVALLRELGYGLPLEQGADGQPIQPADRYHYHWELGARPALALDRGSLVVSGRTLLGLAAGQLPDETTRAEAKRVTRAALAVHLGDRPLHSRNLYRDFLRLRDRNT